MQGNNQVFGNFDQVDETDNFAPIPNAEYDLRILKPELKATAAGTGQYVSINFMVAGGQFDNRMIFEKFNVANPNPAAVEIGLRVLKQLFISAGMQAMGEISWSMIEQLEGRICRGRVSTKTESGYDPKNVIKAFLAPNVIPNQPQMNQMQHNAPAQNHQPDQYQPPQYQEQPQQQQQQPQYAPQQGQYKPWEQ